MDTLTICIDITKVKNEKIDYHLLVLYDFFVEARWKYFSTLILPLFWSFHNCCTITTHDMLKLNIFPAHLSSNLSKGFKIKLKTCFLYLLCVCQHFVRPKPLLNESWSKAYRLKLAFQCSSGLGNKTVIHIQIIQILCMRQNLFIYTLLM